MASMSKAGVADASAAGATSLDALSSAMASEPAEAGAADAGETAAPTAGSESWQPPSRTTRNSRGAMRTGNRSEEHTSELQSLMRNSYAVFCLKTKKQTTITHYDTRH